ncbi:MAG: PfkB family carbohydrate kinase, partial [Bacteroidales bacterium]|nr:PfkB family carbohydrate kinase [Bacteroidales bacterium]
MRRIYGIGETVYDIIFKQGEPRAAKPGGSVLNSMVSIGRLGLPAFFISEYGADNVGAIIDGFLSGNGVDTSHVHKFTGGSTSLALAFLNENNDASYTFYKDFPSKRLDVEFPDAGKDDIVQCGSFYAVWPEIRPRFRGFTLKAGNNGAFIYYDPNFRKTHISDLEKLRPMIIENMMTATIVRGSDEDFVNIFGASGPDASWKEVSKYCGCLIYTSSSEGVWVRTKSYSGKFPVKKIKPVSTIGAGDNFNAGIISSLYMMNAGKSDVDSLSGEQWKQIISSGVEFASHVCMSYENYIDLAFARRYLSAS